MMEGGKSIIGNESVCLEDMVRGIVHEDVKLEDMLFGCLVCKRMLYNPRTTCRGWTMCRECYSVTFMDEEWKEYFAVGLDRRVEDSYLDVLVRNIMELCFPREVKVMKRLREGGEVTMEEVEGMDDRVVSEMLAGLALSDLEKGNTSSAFEKMLMSVAFMGVLTKDLKSKLNKIVKKDPQLQTTDTVRDRVVSTVDGIRKKAKCGEHTPKIDDIEPFECFCCSNLLYQPSTFPTGHTVR